MKKSKVDTSLDGKQSKVDTSGDEEDTKELASTRKPPVLTLPIRDNVPQLFSAPSLTTTRPMGSYIRTIQRRGGTYMIRESLPSEDDPVETDGADRMVEDLYSETIRMSSAANRKATIFKVLYVLATIIFIVGGVVTGILAIQGYETRITKYCIAVIGFVIAGIQTLMMTFSVEKRGVLLKDVSIKLRKISRQVRALRNSELSPKDKFRRLEEYYAEVDEFDLSMYDNSVTSTPVIKATNISQTSLRQSRESDSDLSSDEPVDTPVKKRTFSLRRGKKGITVTSGNVQSNMALSADTKGDEKEASVVVDIKAD